MKPEHAGFSTIQSQLQKQLTPGRYAHSVATAGLASELAQRHGGDPERAYLAGLLHDCARDLSLDQLAEILKAYQGPFADPALRATPELWHDPAGALLASREYGVRDTEVLSAIACHSTGRPGMTLLEKIIYVSDFCEPTRRYPEAAPMRELARNSLDAAVAGVVREKLQYLRLEHKPAHPLTLDLAKEMDEVLD